MTIVAIGVPGSGKSRYLKRLIRSRLERDPTTRVLCYCPHKSDLAAHPGDLLLRGVWYHTGAELLRDVERGRVPRLAIVYRPEDLEALCAAAIAVRNCIVYLDEVLDACTATGWTVESLRKIWGHHRHDGIHLLLALHRPAEVPRTVTAHAQVTLIFRVEEPRDVKYIGDRYGSAYARARDLPMPTWSPLLYPPHDGLDKLGAFMHRG